jgi:uncharacterized protein DUF4349
MSANELTVETLLRAHAPHAPESLRARVLASAEPAAPTRSLTRRPRVLLVAGGLAVLAFALTAAFVHGVRTPAPRATAPVRHVPAWEGAVTTAPDSFRRVAAPAQVKQYSASGAAATASSPSVAGSRLTHTAASLQIRVPSIDSLSAATSRATRIATSLGGYAQSVDYRTPQGGNGASFIELRVPAENVKLAISRLGSLGTIVSQELSVTDLEQTFKTQSAQIAQLRRRIAALRTAITDPSLPESQRVLLRIKLAESRRALAQRLHARKGTVSAGTTAAISLEIGTQKSIAPVAHHRGRLDRMFRSAVGFLALEGMIALFALIVASPVALVAGALWYWRRRAIDRLLAT